MKKSYKWNQSLFKLGLLVIWINLIAVPCFGKKKILIYEGDGAFPACVQRISEALANVVDLEEYTIGFLSENHFREIEDERLFEDVALLVFPGGRASGYLQGLGIEGVQRVQAYVSRGGHYLGICGGGYLGCENIFFTDSSGQCAQKTGLGLFSGAAHGPVMAPFSLIDQAPQLMPVGASLFATIGLSGAGSEPNTEIYWNGGSAFRDKGKSKDEAQSQVSPCEVVVRYLFDDAHKPWEIFLSSQNLFEPDVRNAVVFCRFGEGRVLLSGIHPEVTIDDFSWLSKVESLASLLCYMPLPMLRGYKSVCEKLRQKVGETEITYAQCHQFLLKFLLSKLNIRLKDR